MATILEGRRTLVTLRQFRDIAAMKRTLPILAGLLVLTGHIQTAYAADVQPRLYTNVPVGMQFLSVAYAYSDGEVAFDDSVPLEDVSGEIDLMNIAYARGLDIGGRSGVLTVIVPYMDIELEGLYLGLPAQGQRQGLGDPKVRLAVNLYGAPALSPEEFRGYQQDTIIGASVSVSIPIGRYDKERVINPGTNRWNIAAQLGGSKRIGKWELEAAGRVSWSSKNDEVLGNNELRQDPIGSFLGAVLYHFGPGMWLGGGVAYTFGGDTELNGVERDDHQDNWRTGAAFNFPLARQHSMQLRWTDGVSSRIGADFQTWTLSYTHNF